MPNSNGRFMRAPFRFRRAVRGNAPQYTLRRVRRPGILAALALLALALAAPLAAHDIPRDVVVHAYLKPEGNRLRVTLRLPVVAMRDIPFPRRPDQSLDA